MNNTTCKDNDNINKPKFLLLNEEDQKKIHSESLKILDQIGIKINDLETVDLLKNSGCRVLMDNIVQIPEDLINQALSSAPSQVKLYSRNKQYYLNLEKGNVYFGTGSDTHFILDPINNKRRKWKKKDIADGSILCDSLENIDFVMCMGIAGDVNIYTADVHHFEAMINNTTKPIVFTSLGTNNLKNIIKIASLVAGGQRELALKPNIAIFVETLPPLQITNDTLNKMKIMATADLPIVFSSGPSLGGTGPVTIAGSVGLANAEELCGLVITQLIKKGSPFIYGGGGHPFDMQTSVLGYGAPETSMFSGAAVEMAKFYRLPAWGYAGCSDSKIVDQQAAIEGTMNVFSSLLVGANLVHDVGYLESGYTTSFEMMALTDYIIEMGRYYMKGVPTDKDSFAFDAIKSARPSGHFLDNEHTLENFKNIWYSKLCNRQKYNDWVMLGGSSCLGERIRNKVLNSIKNHKPEIFPEETRKQIARIVREADDNV